VNPLKHYFLNAELNTNEMAVRYYQIAIISVYI
jgi:hypothetical protein